MLAKIIRGRDFAGLHNYLTSEVKQLDANDIELRNLVSLETAVAEMRAAASRSTRVEKPVYHVVLSWAEHEHPTRDQQFAEAHALIERIGLGDHQALLVRHPEEKEGAVPGKGRHYELHIDLNRVGPDGRAAAMSHDYALIERTVAAIAAESGMRVVPGRHNGVTGTTTIFEGGSGAARSYTAATGTLTAAATLRANPAVMQALVAARTQGWPALLAAFEDAGVTVTTSSRTTRGGQTAGLVLVPLGSTQGEKISALDGDGLKWGLPSLEKELGPLDPHLVAEKSRSKPAEPPQQAVELPSRDLLKQFQAARHQALACRHEIRQRHKQVREEMQARQRHDRTALEKAATERRERVEWFFGTRSTYGAAFNVVVDHRSAARMKALRVEQQQEVEALRKVQRADLDSVPVPIWRDWQRRGEEPVQIQPSTISKTVDQPAPAAPLKAPDGQEADAAALLVRRIEEEIRRERLDRKKRGRSQRRTGLLDIPCVASSAGFMAAFAEGRLPLRSTIMIVTTLAAVNALTPVLLASAAVQLARHGVIAYDRTRMRADIDAAKAARAGFEFKTVPAKHRVRYARLAASDLLTDGGSPAGPILKVMDAPSVSRFVAWYVHASDAQREVVQQWGDPHARRHPPKRKRDDGLGR